MSSTIYQEGPRKISLSIGLWGITCGLMALTLYMVFFYAPGEQTMGVIQRIFYIHVSSAWVAFLAFFLVMISSIIYLITNRRSWDRRAYAAAEVGTLFCTIVLVTFPLWAKPVWNVWWAWDLRLITTLALWVMYVAYLVLRKYVLVEGGEKLIAVFGIIAFVVVPLVYFSIRWGRTLHPGPIIMGGADSALEPRMAATLFVSLVSFIVLFFYLFQHRFAIERMEDELEDIRQELIEQEHQRQDFLVENQNFIIEDYTFKEYKKHE